MTGSTPTYVTSAEAIISVTLTGVKFPTYIKTWSTFSGGDASAATSNLFPGGIANGALAVPGPKSRSNVTVELPYTWDIHSLVASIEAAINQPMTASYVPTDADGNVNSNKPVSRNGILKNPICPAFDAKSGDAVFLSLVMECNY